ncbi:hypothetical protein GH714_004231 [Hevea brasiliensis]|uniref:Uncharacterized protein n=1 Tax=Hevea brasiliensis TaxID=3981 RepID=A0A6A6K9F0_HEVBR|nr:hypothetical protein GH714_004231 [Hevea brasiliensis]
MEVMNTVLSAMSLDYPAEKLHVCLSDDGGAAITLHGMREAWKFARWWLPFCSRYGIKTRCPNAYFSGGEDEYNHHKSTQFIADREKIQEEYENLKQGIVRARENGFHGERNSWKRWNHSPIIELQWHGMDGVKGPILSGTNFYINRQSLFASNIREVRDFKEVKNSFGLDYQLPRSMRKGADDYPSLLEDTKVLASCKHEDDSKWGDKVGFIYNTVVEDFLTGLKLRCKGWKSVYLSPARPQFLATSPTNLNDLLIQNTRRSSGLLGVGISKCCPLIYGPSRMSFHQSLCYAECAFFPLFYCLSLCCFATIPQLCLLSGIYLYPEVTSSL